MHWNDLETYQGRLGINVRQKKTNKRLWVPMTEELQAAIATWERRMGTILVKADGTPFERKELTDMWTYERKTNPALQAAQAAQESGLSAARAAVNRRGTATAHRSKRGRDLAMVGMSVEMVKRYCRLSDQRDNALAAVYRLDRTREERGAVIGKKAVG